MKRLDPSWFTPVPAWATNEECGVGRTLGCHELVVYVIMLAFRQRFTKTVGLRGAVSRKSRAAQSFYVSLPMIGAAGGLSRSTAYRALRRLEGAGLLEIVTRGSRGATNTYAVRDQAKTSQVVSAGHYPAAGSVSGTCPPSPTETRWCQADTPVRTEVRVESQNRKNQRGERGEISPSFLINGKAKTPPLIEQYRDYIAGLKGDPKAVAGACRALAAQLRVSEKEANALLARASSNGNRDPAKSGCSTA